MSKLAAFLLANTVDNLVEEVVVSDRFRDEEGNLLKFKVKALTPDEFAELQKECTTYGKKGKVSFNNQMFNERLIVKNTLDPAFNDAEFLKKAGCISPEQAINKMLLAGEVAELAKEITRVSGFDDNLDELKSEAKN